MKKTFRSITYMLLMLSAVILATSVKAAYASQILSAEYADLMEDSLTEVDQYTNDEFSSGRLIIKGKRHGLTFEETSPVTVLEEDNYIYILQYGDSESAERAYNILKNSEEIESIQPDRSFPLETLNPEGSLAEDEEGMSWGVAAMKADKYAKYVSSKTNSSIVVAVVDSGVFPHSMIKDRIVPGGYAVGTDTNDDYGHGTHVAGIVVDSTPGLNVKIMPVRVGTRYGSSDKAMGDGITFAANKGAKVINLSMGLPYYGSHSWYLEECIHYAVQKGAVVVISAGNNSKNTSGSCPADINMDGVIVVGAVNSLSEKAEFSNYGASVDIVGPGVHIKGCTNRAGATMILSGTSMAAPHIAGVVAMYRLMYPSYTPAKIENLLKKNIKDLGAKGRDDYYGAGFPDLSKAIEIPVGKVTLDQSNITLRKGMKYTLTATLTPQNASNKKISWSSSNKAVAVVSNGTVTVKGIGTTTIKAKSANGVSASCKITVVNKVTNVGLALKLPGQSAAALLGFNSSTNWTKDKTLSYPGKTFSLKKNNLNTSLSFYTKDKNVKGAFKIRIKTKGYYIYKLKIGASQSTIDTSLKQKGYKLKKKAKISGGYQWTYKNGKKTIVVKLKNKKCFFWSYSYQ